MKFDVIVNAPMEPRIFPITAVIGGIPCIRFLTWTIIICRLKLLRSIAGWEWDVTPQHDSPEGRVQEVHPGDFVGVLSKKSSSSPLK